MRSHFFVFDSVLDSQVKFKILYLSNLCSKEDGFSVSKVNVLINRVVLKILSVISLEEVLSGRFRSRLVYNYFRKCNFEIKKIFLFEYGMLFYDLTYESTFVVSNIYDLPVKGYVSDEIF